MKRIKRIALLVILTFALLLPSAIQAYPGCQTMCLDYAAAFAQQCFLATGDATACTQAASMLYENCMLNNCPGRPPR